MRSLLAFAWIAIVLVLSFHIYARSKDKDVRIKAVATRYLPFNHLIRERDVRLENDPLTDIIGRYITAPKGIDVGKAVSKDVGTTADPALWPDAGDYLGTFAIDATIEDSFDVGTKAFVCADGKTLVSAPVRAIRCAGKGSCSAILTLDATQTLATAKAGSKSLFTKPCS